MKKFPPPISSSVSFVGGLLPPSSFCGGGPIVPACEDATRVKRRLLFDRAGVFMADIIFTLFSLLLCL